MYVDNIIIFSPTFEKHMEYLEKVLSILEKPNLQINVGKVKAILNYPVPRSHKEVASFLGVVNWYWRFIHQCVAKMHHLRELRKSTKF